jgi:hypothetical protein
MEDYMKRPHKKMIQGSDKLLSVLRVVLRIAGSDEGDLKK